MLLALQGVSGRDGTGRKLVPGLPGIVPVQVAYGNKDYAAGLCVFGTELASFGQRHSTTDHLSSQKQNNGDTTKREMLNKLQDARHIIISKQAVHTRMFV